MSDIFISYSRKDIAYARLLHNALKDNNLETWIDWQDIPPSTEWLKEVFTAIEGANTFIFILSASSAISDICQKEIDHARENNKRIIPIVIDDVAPSKVHPALSAINWIFSRTKDELQPSIEKLIEAIQTDYDWVKAHTRLQVRALEWERAERDKSFLLQGTDLSQAENWLAESVDKEPEPTLQQTRYIQSSRQGAIKRQRNLLVGVGAALVVTVVLSILAVINSQRATQSAHSLATQVVVAEEAQAEAVVQKDIAVENARLARIRELTAISQQAGIRYDIALLLGIESFNQIDNYQTRDNLLQLTHRNPQVASIHPYDFERNIAFSLDGNIAASGLNDGTVVLWDIASNSPIGDPLEMKIGADLSSVSISPDGKTLVSGNAAGFFTLVDVSSGKRIGSVLDSFHAQIPSIAFNHNGNILASGHERGSILLWDVVGGSQISDFSSAVDSIVTSLDFNPVKDILASTIDDRVILWDIKTGQPIGEPWAIQSATSVSFSDDGNTLAVGGRDRKITLWDINTRQPVGETLDAHTGRITGVSFLPDGKTLVSCSEDDTIIYWDLAEDESVSMVDFDGIADITRIAFSSDGHMLAIAYKDGNTIFLDTETGQRAGNPVQTDVLSAISFSSDGKSMVVGYGLGKIVVWDIATGQMITESWDTKDVPFGKVWHISSIAFSADGRNIATGYENGRTIIWDAAERQRVGDPLKGHTETVMSLDFSPDGKTLVSGSQNGTLIFWDVDSLQPIGDSMRANIDDITSIKFSPDGEILAAGYLNGSIMLWDVESMLPLGDPLARINSQAQLIDIAFSLDGNVLNVLYTDGSIVQWDTGSELWRNSLCEKVSRNFTQEEWSYYFPGEPYRVTCDQWPAGN